MTNPAPFAYLTSSFGIRRDLNFEWKFSALTIILSCSIKAVFQIVCDTIITKFWEQLSKRLQISDYGVPKNTFNPKKCNFFNYRDLNQRLQCQHYYSWAPKHCAIGPPKFNWNISLPTYSTISIDPITVENN